jgi:Zn-dependent peptidase ImmA (M78 family)
VTVKDDAAKAAKRLRGEIWGDQLPVDPVRIARTLGIDVVDAHLGADVGGALVKERGQDPTIFLNALDSKNRRRFSCAHEVGHFVRRKDDPEEYEYVDFRGKLASMGYDPEEIFANNFAAELLMPDEDVREFHKEGLDEVAMSVRFDVSLDAIHNRLKSLKLIK